MHDTTRERFCTEIEKKALSCYTIFMITVMIIVLLHVQALGIRYSDGRNKEE